MEKQKLTFNDLPETLAEMKEDIETVKMILKGIQEENPQSDDLLGMDGVRDFLEKVFGYKPSVSTVYSNVSSGKLPASKQNGRLVFSKKELTEYFLTGEREALTDKQKEAVQKMQNARKKPKSNEST